MLAIHICQRDDPSTGGAVRVAVEYVKRLSQFGVDARLLFLYGDRGFFYEKLGDRCDYLGLKDSKDILGMPRLVKYLQQQHPQIVHHHDDMLWPQLLTLKHPGYKKIVHAHGGGSAKPQPFKVAALYASQRYSVDAVVCITAEAKASQQINVGFAPEILYVLHNGVDLTHYTPPTTAQKHQARQTLGLPLDQPVAGFVGRLHNVMKGADDFLKVLAALPSEYWGVVAGMGPDLENLKQQAQESGISDRIVFAGLLNDPAIAYQAMDVFCMTSRHEPFGLTIIEAMACDVPAIGFRCPGGSGEILTDATGVMIENRNVGQMATAVQSAYQRVAPWQERITAAHSVLATNYSWDISAARLADLYYTLC
jgi:glycosyltransferase involved in cell wall biosynthesis